MGLTFTPAQSHMSSHTHVARPTLRALHSAVMSALPHRPVGSMPWVRKADTLYMRGKVWRHSALHAPGRPNQDSAMLLYGDVLLG